VLPAEVRYLCAGLGLLEYRDAFLP
jgi:hypothetical protein